MYNECLKLKGFFFIKDLCFCRFVLINVCFAFMYSKSNVIHTYYSYVMEIGKNSMTLFSFS